VLGLSLPQVEAAASRLGFRDMLQGNNEFKVVGTKSDGTAKLGLRPRAYINVDPIPAERLVSAPDLPIYASVRGGKYDESRVVTSEPIDFVKRPEPLAKARNGYGLYVMGDSMEPAFRQGDLALIHPNIPPKPGDEVVVCSQDKDGEHYALIKLLIGVTPTSWRLKQYNPAPGEPDVFTLDREEWPVCHLVVGSYRKR
jgi:SOS-response transcriptional repressor LexA